MKPQRRRHPGPRGAGRRICPGRPMNILVRGRPAIGPGGPAVMPWPGRTHGRNTVKRALLPLKEIFAIRQRRLTRLHPAESVQEPLMRLQFSKPADHARAFARNLSHPIPGRTIRLPTVTHRCSTRISAVCAAGCAARIASRIVRRGTEPPNRLGRHRRVVERTVVTQRMPAVCTADTSARPRTSSTSSTRSPGSSWTRRLRFRSARGTGHVRQAACGPLLHTGEAPACGETRRQGACLGSRPCGAHDPGECAALESGGASCPVVQGNPGTSFLCG